MKRFGLALFAALAVAGVSSALTVNWDAALMGNALYGGWQGVAIVSGNITEAKAYADVLGVSGNTATWKGENGLGFAQVTNVSEGTRYGTVNSGANGSYGPLWSENGISTRKVYQGTFALDNPSGGFALVLFNDYNQSYAVYNYRLWESVQGEDTLSLDLGDIGWTGNKNSAGSGTLAVHDAVTVPEPTALALLALGVAGLALRRRVA